MINSNVKKRQFIPGLIAMGAQERDGSAARRNLQSLALAILFLFALLLAACDSGYSFKEKKDIPNGQWTYQDTLDFRFTIEDTSATYNIYLDFEHADTFSTQNLYVRLYTKFPDGARLSKQRSFDLFDLQGAPHGQCSGHTCRLHVLLQENAFFNLPGEYVITLEQFTRRDPLPGIYAIGLAVEPSKGKRK